jgi:type I restriction enzyme M protein
MSTNIQTKANMIWNIAEIIRGKFKPHEYGQVVLPFTLLKRLEDCLQRTKNQVVSTNQEVGGFAVNSTLLKKASGLPYYNTSPFSLKTLVGDPTHLEDNFKAYINGFSDNIQDILKNFKIDTVIKDLVGDDPSDNKLLKVIEEFNKDSSYMGDDQISSTDMGYIFEELVRKFSESYGEDAGAHFTARDIIYTMTDILVIDDNRSESPTVYDMTMGTSQMLTCMQERLKVLDSEIDVYLCGQEYNPMTFAIAKADMIIRGGEADNMRFGNTLTSDQFSGWSFDYIISNPPFGVEWKSEKESVEKEAKKKDTGRFCVGLPKI